MINKIVEVAKSWLNTPYHSMAKIKGVGVDCGQFIIAVYEECGLVESISTGSYTHDWHLHKGEEKYLNFVEKYCDKVDTPLPGDIIVFQFGRCVSHGGIFIGENKIIHSYVNLGVIYSDINDAILCKKNGQSRAVGIYRVRR